MSTSAHWRKGCTDDLGDDGGEPLQMLSTLSVADGEGGELGAGGALDSPNCAVGQLSVES